MRGGAPSGLSEDALKLIIDSVVEKIQSVPRERNRPNLRDHIASASGGAVRRREREVDEDGGEEPSDESSDSDGSGSSDSDVERRPRRGLKSRRKRKAANRERFLEGLQKGTVSGSKIVIRKAGCGGCAQTRFDKP